MNADRWQDPADLDWHSRHARQVHCHCHSVWHRQSLSLIPGYRPWHCARCLTISCPWLCKSAAAATVSQSCFFIKMSAARGSAVSMRSRQCEQFVHCQFCQLDYCNAILNGAADVQMKRLQSVQNTVDRLFSGARRRGHVSHGSPPEPSSATRQRLFFRLLWGQEKMSYKQQTFFSFLPNETTSMVLHNSGKN